MEQSIVRLMNIQQNWITICDAHIDEYGKAFSSHRGLTSFICSMIDKLGENLNLLTCPEYYFLDFVFYKKEDLVPDKAITWNKGLSIWLKRIRIAFEHENRLDCSSGGYQEFSHLMLTNADSKVLVGYGDSLNSYDSYAFDYQSLMKNLGVETDPILFIGEYAPMHGQKSGSSLYFESYIITETKILKHDTDNPNWRELGQIDKGPVN
ncbi:MAG: hypothetical protein WCS59_01340 [Sphaerochaetaceae bacterium]|nr:hypothetical protein [Sphaerochaetaceae bacterium]